MGRSGEGGQSASNIHKNESLLTARRSERHNKNLRRFESSGDVNMIGRKEFHLHHVFFVLSRESYNRNEKKKDEKKIKCRGHKFARDSLCKIINMKSSHFHRRLNNFFCWMNLSRGKCQALLLLLFFFGNESGLWNYLCRGLYVSSGRNCKKNTAAFLKTLFQDCWRFKR